MIKKFLKLETSKKLLLLVTVIWFIATIANYILNYFLIDILQTAQTYSIISEIFKWEILVYSGKATIENYNKIGQVVQTQIDKMVG